MRLGDLATSSCRCAHGPGMGAILYHSYSDVAAEKIRVNAVVNDMVNAWNTCSDSATDATGQQLSSDVAGFYQGWSSFTNTGSENYANLPDNDEWDTMQTYETQLTSLVNRVNAYCGTGLLGPAPTGKSPTNPVVMLTAVVVTLAIAVVAIEVAPLLTAGVDILTD